MDVVIYDQLKCMTRIITHLNSKKLTSNTKYIALSVLSCLRARVQYTRSRSNLQKKDQDLFNVFSVDIFDRPGISKRNQC